MASGLTKHFRGRHALVTGGSLGIGFALARRLIQCDAAITLVARDAERLARARESLLAENPRASVRLLPLDVSDDGGVRRAVSSLADAPPVDLLINNAGIAHPGYFWDTPAEDFSRQQSINFLGAVHVTRALLPSLLQSSAPRVVFVGSVSSVVASLANPGTARASSRCTPSRTPCAPNCGRGA